MCSLERPTGSDQEAVHRESRLQSEEMVATSRLWSVAPAHGRDRIAASALGIARSPHDMSDVTCA